MGPVWEAVVGRGVRGRGSGDCGLLPWALLKWFWGAHSDSHVLCSPLLPGVSPWALAPLCHLSPPSCSVCPAEVGTMGRALQLSEGSHGVHPGACLHVWDCGPLEPSAGEACCPLPGRLPAVRPGGLRSPS